MIDVQKKIGEYYSKNTKPFDPLAQYAQYMNTDRQLPNGGGSYSMEGGLDGIELNRPDLQTLFPGTQAPNMTDRSGQQVYAAPPIFQGGSKETPQASSQGGIDPYAKYRDPKTGEVMTPQQWATSMASKIPKSRTGNGDIGQYAGDALMNQARTLNNTRNDIATGTTDPYKVASQSGIAYSPSELAAIEKAYAGIYDPAINDVFSRLKNQEDENKRMADREDKIFSVNEEIRKWKETTGSKSGSDSSGGTTADRFTQSQLNAGASAAKMTEEEFLKLDPELANFYINDPKVYDTDEEKEVSAKAAAEQILREYKDGLMTKDEAMAAVQGFGLPAEVTLYFISQMPDITEEEKKSLWDKITFWN